MCAGKEHLNEQYGPDARDSLWCCSQDRAVDTFSIILAGMGYLLKSSQKVICAAHLSRCNDLAAYFYFIESLLQPLLV